jgi:hypothetical protein
MREPTVSNSDIISLLYRQLKWLTDAELSVIAKEFEFKDQLVGGGIILCGHIVGTGKLKPFVDFCRRKFDTQVKARQNPPKHRMKELLTKTIQAGTSKLPNNEKIDNFVRCIDWRSYTEFKKQEDIKKRELTDDEKLDILMKAHSEDVLEKKVFDSFLWRAFWLQAVDDLNEEIQDEADRDRFGY